jgi:hypothetical protein
VEYNIRLLGSIYIFVICGDKSGWYFLYMT